MSSILDAKLLCALWRNSCNAPADAAEVAALAIACTVDADAADAAAVALAECASSGVLAATSAGDFGVLGAAASESEDGELEPESAMAGLRPLLGACCFLPRGLGARSKHLSSRWLWMQRAHGRLPSQLQTQSYDCT